MAIAASDLLLYCAVNMPDVDGSTAGGAIDVDRRAVFTQMSTNDTIEVVSSNAGDTMNITVEGRTASGTVASETKALTGTTFITLSTLSTVERILKAEVASDPAGTITVRRATGDVTIGQIPAGERAFLMPFRKCAADASGGTTRNFYAKVFLKNNHGTLALLGATTKQNADPDARITHLNANAVDDSATVANRQTAPAAGATQDPDTFDDTDKPIPGTDLAAGSAIGVWLRLQLPAGDAPHRSTYTLELAGTTT